MRKKICAGNWKMYKSPQAAAQYFREWPSASLQLKCDVVVFPPAYNLPSVANAIAEMCKITLAQNFYFGSQNHSAQNEGAFTGESSPLVIKEIGAQYALVGHSERRSLFHESDADTALKVLAASSVGLIPMLCVGETLAERQSAQTEAVVERQLRAGLSKLKSLTSDGFVIAYEPVWAIGTGQVATPEQAEAVHQFIRTCLGKMATPTRAQDISILYGGSVKPDNAKGLAAQPNIDGFLVGGASLKPADFATIAQSLA